MSANVASSSARPPFAIVEGFLHEAPVDLMAMSEALGLTVDMAAKMGTEQSGRILRKGNGKSGYHIEVNGSHSDYRKRFTLAHEVAHFLLHRDLIGDGIEDSALYRSRLGDPAEYEANRLAAQILMPAPLVRNVYKAGLKWLAGLSAAFAVSEEAMRIRLKQLGLAP